MIKMNELMAKALQKSWKIDTNFVFSFTRWYQLIRKKKNFVIKINNYNRYLTPRGASIDTIRAMNIVLLDHRMRP